MNSSSFGKIFVGNLGDRGSRTELEDHFGKYGPVREVWVGHNPPGFGFVFFENHHDAEDAVEALNDSWCCGGKIRVELAKGGDSRNSKKKFGPKCYECDRVGHSARECTRRPGFVYKERGEQTQGYSRSRSRSNERRQPRRRSHTRSPPPRRKYESRDKSPPPIRSRDKSPPSMRSRDKSPPMRPRRRSRSRSASHDRRRR